VTVEALVAAGAERLEGIAGVAARLEAQVLMGVVLGCDRTGVLVQGRDALNAGTVAWFEGLVERRAGGEPLAYITGWREFYGRCFRVEPGVLVPRQETETLVTAALSLPWDSVMEVGVGSGCVLVTLARLRPDARAVGTDVMPVPVRVARANAEAQGVRVEVIQQDGLAEGAFDLIVSNPPYVAMDDVIGPDVTWEPEEALYAGADGMDFYRRLAREAGDRLTAAGVLLVEIGDGQEPLVEQVFAGWREVGRWRDLGGRVRVMGFRPVPS